LSRLFSFFLGIIHPSVEISGVVLGGLFLSLLVKALKRVLKHERPSESRKRSYGMPSTHSSVLFFFGTYFAAWVAYSSNWPYIFPALSTLIVGLLSYERIHSKQHYASQVIAGGIFGILFGLSHFFLIQPFLAHFVVVLFLIPDMILLVLSLVGLIFFWVV